VEESTPSEKEKETADTVGAGNVEAPAATARGGGRGKEEDFGLF
jgi:hypothetical protein